MKIKRTFVRETAYLKLRDSIVEGKLKPGFKLKDKELAQKMGVSRTPIREALLRLEDEGLVKTKANSSTTVSSIDLDEAEKLYSIVSCLEQLALKRAFESIGEREIQKMEQANEKLIKSLINRDQIAALDADIEFHSVYIDPASNAELKQITSLLKQKLKRIDLYYFDKVQNREESYKEHKMIIEAIRRKDLAAALKAVEKNCEESYARINPKEKYGK